MTMPETGVENPTGILATGMALFRKQKGIDCAAVPTLSMPKEKT